MSCYANINRVVVIITLVFALLIFPIYTKVLLFINIKNKTAQIKVKFFGLKVFKISAKLDGKRIWIKRTLKKPYSVKIKNIFASSGKLLRLKGLGVLSLRSVINVGVNGDVFLPNLAISTVFTAENLLSHAITVKRPRIKTDNVINVYENSRMFNVFLNASLIFNLIFVIINIVSKLTEMIFKNGK